MPCLDEAVKGRDMPETTAFILACCGLYWMAVGAWTFFSTFRKVNPTASAIAPDSEPSPSSEAIPDRRLGRRRLGGLFWFTLGLGALWFAEIGGGASPPVQPEFEDVSSFDQSAIRQIDAWLQRQVDLSQFPSLSVAVVSNGAIVYQGAFGFEDLEAGVKATPETSYPVASVTKVFTTLLALMLHARGVVDLDKRWRPICRKACPSPPIPNSARRLPCGSLHPTHPACRVESPAGFNRSRAATNWSRGGCTINWPE